VADYLAGELTAAEYVERIAPTSDAYNGFNLVLGDRNSLIWYSNRGAGDARNGQRLEPGIYGISNGLLDAPWPKVLRTKAQFASLLCQGAPEDAFFEMLADTTRAPDVRLPDTGIELELERNRERYQFLRWGQQAFGNFSVVPPDTGIVHQVNLEYLASVAFAKETASERPDDQRVRAAYREPEDNKQRTEA
jgi:hypothetical protein